MRSPSALCQTESMKPRKPAVKDSVQKATRLRRKPIKQIETATKSSAKAANKKLNTEAKEDFNQAAFRAVQETIRISENQK